MLPLASVTGGLTESITGAVGDYGLYAVFGLMLVDAVFPAASELVMVYGGALAAGAFAGSVSLFGAEIPSGFWAWLAIALAGTIGYLLGSVAGWAIGFRGGRPFVERHGRWFHLGPERLERADGVFDRFGDWFVAFGRVTPVLRSFVAIPAGLGEMPLRRYVPLSVPGSAAWCFVLAGIGWALGANWERFHGSFHFVDYAVLALILLGAAYLGIRWRSTRLARRATDPAG